MVRAEKDPVRRMSSERSINPLSLFEIVPRDLFESCKFGIGLIFFTGDKENCVQYRDMVEDCNRT